MTRTLLDLDGQLLAQAMRVSGRPTKVATVTLALEELVRRRRGLELGELLRSGIAADLDDPAVVAAAQR